MRAPAVLALALLLAPAVLAEHTEGAQPAQVVGPLRVGYRFEGENVTHTFEPGDEVVVRFFFEALDNGTYVATVAPLAGGANATVTNVTQGVAPTNASATLAFEVDDAPAPVATRTFHVVVEGVRNGTRFPVDQGNVEVTYAVVAPPAPVEPLLPVWAWIAGGLLVLAAGGALLARRRPRQVRAVPRSRTMQELAVEERAARARARDREALEAERRAVEEREAERLAQRENSILEAKRQDVLRSIELARQRMERGEINAFQFQKLKEKKEQQLADLDRQGGAP